METATLHRKIARKGSNPAKIAELISSNPDLIPGLIAGINASKPELRFGSEKVLRILSEKQPGLIYPYFGFLNAMLDCDNSFLKWGAILSIANLACVDREGRIESIFDRYFGPVPGPVMITAANIIRGSARIALAKPQLADRIASEILKVEKGKYKTPECRNVAIGHAIDALDLFFDQIKERDRIVRFVVRQISNRRHPVRKRAQRFLKRRNIRIPGAKLH